MRPLTRPLLAVAAAALAGGLLASPASAKPAVTLTAGGLSRGPDVTVPHLDGTTVVDGTLRVPVKAQRAVLLGKSGSAYVVGTLSRQGGHGRIYRVATDGSRTLLARASAYMSLLSGDGGTLVTSRVGRTSTTTISAYDVATATTKVRREFRDYAVALDAQDDRVILGSSRKTLLWTTSTDAVRIVSRDAGYVADLGADVVSTFTKDPYLGGCAEVRRVTTAERLWRSCTERVAAVSPDGSRIATVALLSDGVGPGRVDTRTITGQHLGRYQVPSGWFGAIRFETPTALLLDVNGARKAFTARCTGAACERASALRPAETLRTSGRVGLDH